MEKVFEGDIQPTPRKHYLQTQKEGEKGYLGLPGSGKQQETRRVENRAAKTCRKRKVFITSLRERTSSGGGGR